jgi:asparagine synthase (glutamine-hydrolysing)
MLGSGLEVGVAASETFPGDDRIRMAGGMTQGFAGSVCAGDGEGGRLLRQLERAGGAPTERRFVIQDGSSAPRTICFLGFGSGVERAPAATSMPGVPALVLDASLYNIDQLKSRLQAEGTLARTSDLASQEEVVLAAFEAWGADCVSQLEGMFALALWDPANRRLLLARDRLGFKSLYWGRYGDGSGSEALMFATSLKTLIRSGAFARELDPDAVECFAWNGFVPAPVTLLKGARLLEPGVLALVDATSFEMRQQVYWQLPAYDHSPSRVVDLRAALQEAVGRQMAGPDRAAFFLSGGIDSSAVVALAARATRDPLETFNVSFEEAEFDESVYARAVAEALGTRHREIRVSERFFRDQLPSALLSLDQPSFDALNTFLVSRAVADAGVHTALGGTGGDDLFGGNRTFFDIPRGIRYAPHVGRLPDAVLEPLCVALSRWKVGRTALPPQTRWGKLRDVARARGHRVGTYQIFYALYTQKFLDELLLARSSKVSYGLSHARFEELSRLSSEESNPLLYAIALLELSVFVGDRLLRDIACVGNAAGVEVRSPLLDDRVIESFPKVGEARLFHPLGRKQALRDAALSELDPRLFDRPKAGFVLPMERWCREGLHDELNASFNDRELCRRSGLSPESVSRLWNSFQAGEPGLYWSRVWALFVYLWWCKEYDMSAGS